MFIGILNTWTICVLLLVVIPKFSLESPVNNGTIQESMYDVVVKKCPNLNPNTLKENELLTKRCLNWEEINVTNSFSAETKENVECLVFYEALVSFCTNMGDNLLKVVGIIPSNSVLQNNNYSLETVCSSKHNIYSINKTEHNISSLIQNNADCTLLCTSFTKTRVSDICLFAYYFGTFDINKFTGKLAELHPGKVNSEIDHAQESVNNNPIQPGTDFKSTKQENESKDSISKHHGDFDPPKDDAPVLPPPESKIEKELQPEDQPAQKPNPLDINNKIPKTLLSDKDTQVKGDSVALPSKNDNDAGGIKDEKLSNPDAKKTVDEKDREPAAETPEKSQKPNEKVQNVDDNTDYGPDQQDMVDDDGDEDQEGTLAKQDEPALHKESNDPKTTSKNAKPVTVEDESINSFITPEDDMDGDSYFFSYFIVLMCLCIVGYVGYHNRQKILALLLEGKKDKRPGRRRPNSANYHKLDTNLEEAISSSCTKNASNVIY